MKTAPRIVFVGVHREAEPPLRWLLDQDEAVLGLVTLDPESRRQVSGAVDLEPLARAAGRPTLEVKNVNEPHAAAWIASHRPDVVLVVGWTQLLKREVLAIPRLVCLGFHASLLPKYRGRAPINWALIHGETETGNTMIVLEPGADEGDIVAQRRIPIGDEDDCATLYDKVAATEVEMLAEVLPGLREGRLPRRPQDGALATVMPRRRPEDGLIDWSRTTKQVHDWVRAQTHPYPGAFSLWDGRRVHVWRTAPLGLDTAAAALPGTIDIDAGRPRVRTGDGWIEILRAQIEGDEETDGAALAARFLTPGRRFGDPAPENR